MPSFQKKEVGSVGQRIQLAPLGHQHARKSSISNSLLPPTSSFDFLHLLKGKFTQKLKLAHDLLTLKSS